MLFWGINGRAVTTRIHTITKIRSSTRRETEQSDAHSLNHTHSVSCIREQGHRDSREREECHLLAEQTHFTLNLQLTCSSSTFETVFPSRPASRNSGYARKLEKPEGAAHHMMNWCIILDVLQLKHLILNLICILKKTSNRISNHYTHTNWKPLTWHKLGTVADIVIVAWLLCGFDPVCYTSSVLILSHKTCLKGRTTSHLFHKRGRVLPIVSIQFCVTFCRQKVSNPNKTNPAWFQSYNRGCIPIF